MVLEVAEILIVNYLYKVNDIGYIGICTLATFDMHNILCVFYYQEEYKKNESPKMFAPTRTKS